MWRSCWSVWGWNPDAQAGQLSAGLRRRVLLGRAMVAEPELLLLDEPTNHLDIQTIQWLEQQLLQYPGALVFVTHDRMFLGKLSTRILEVDRARVFSWDCDYEDVPEAKSRTTVGPGSGRGGIR